MGTMLHFRTNNQTTEPKNQTILNGKVKVETAGKASLGCGQCPWVGKLRTVFTLKNRDVIRDSAVQLGLTHQRGANGVDSSTCSYLKW
jgi:hypothetical protein